MIAPPDDVDLRYARAFVKYLDGGGHAPRLERYIAGPPPRDGRLWIDMGLGLPPHTPQYVAVALDGADELSPAEQETLAALEEAMIHALQEDGR